jgi:hypothetical protein
MDPWNDLANEQQLFTIDEAPGAGRGIFASQDLAAGERVLVAKDLSVHVLFREYRGEICCTCFGYDLGGKQPIRDATHGIAFCSEQCQIKFLLRSDDLCMAARAAVEKLIKTKSTRNQAAEDAPLAAPARPKPAEIKKAWMTAETQGSLICIARLGTPLAPPTKPQLRALQRALSAPVASPDIITFLLSVILATYNTSKASESVTAKHHILSTLESEPQPYLSPSELHQYTTSYLHLLSVLPLSLLPFVTAENLHSTKSRETHNSFGIRSLFDNGAEFFGYGVWPSASYFNHSCEPNLVRVREGRRWIFSVGDREIKKGEQLSISYVGQMGGVEGVRDESGEVMSGKKRRALLKRTWGFECACGWCVGETGG